jgi:hypothetical protein
MSNGDDALKYVVGKARALVGNMSTTPADFSKCPVGEQHSRNQSEATTLLVEMLCISLEHQAKARKDHWKVPTAITTAITTVLVGLIEYLKSKGSL